MKKKNGFTLIELLASIALLGVILTIATISISSISDSIRRRQRTNIETDLKIAASKYVSNTGNKKVYVETLIQQGYVTAENEEKEIYDPLTKDSLNCYYWDFTKEEAEFISGDCNAETIEYHEFNIKYCAGNSCAPNKAIPDGWINDKVVILGTDFNESGTSYVWINPLAPDLVHNGATYKIASFPAGYINEVFEVIVNYNNKEYRENVRLKIDVTNPEVTSLTVSDNDIWTGPKTLTASFEDNESGLAAYAITKSASAPSSWTNMPSNHAVSQVITENATYYVWVKDNAGNINNKSIVVNKIDTYAPSVPTSEIREVNASGSILQNTSSWRNYNVWWGNWNSIDNETSVDHYEYSTNCTGSVSGNLKVEGYTYSNHQYQFCIRAVDIHGNASDWSSAYTFNVDTTKPQCGGATGGAPTWTNEDRTINQECTDSGSGCVQATYSKTYDKTTTSDTVTITDKAGNTNTCTYSVLVDKDVPSVSAFSISSKQTEYNSKETSLSATLSDTGSGIKYICVSSTNSANDCTWTSNTNTSYSADYTFNSNSYNGTKFTLYFFAKDDAGNISSSKSASYTIYTACTQKEISGYGSYGACSPTCGPGKKYRDVYYKDSYLGTACATVKNGDSADCNNGACCSEGTYSCSCGANGVNTCSRWNGCLSQTQSYTAACTYTTNAYRYSGCDKYYITTCNNGTCSYNEKNGASSNGTIAYSSLSTSLGSGCSAPTCPAYISSSKSGSVVTFYTNSNCTRESYTKGGCTDKGTYGTTGFKLDFSGKSSCSPSMKRYAYATWGEKYTYNSSWKTLYCDKTSERNGCYCTGDSVNAACKNSNTACAC